jgi:hypothetical protein
MSRWRWGRTRPAASGDAAGCQGLHAAVAMGGGCLYDPVLAPRGVWQDVRGCGMCDLGWLTTYDA